MDFQIEKIHHVAYRCHNAKETAAWYKEMLGMDFILAFAEDHVPSTKAFDPYMHIFLDAGMGNVLAFFELPTQPDMGRDEKVILPFLMDRISRIKCSSMAAYHRWLDEAFHDYRTTTNGWHNPEYHLSC